jgi:hypothetical protein
LNRINTVQDRQTPDDQYHHKYNKLLVDYVVVAVVVDKMFVIVVVDEDDRYFVEIDANQMGNVVYDDNGIVDDEKQLMNDGDFVRFVLEVYLFHSIELSNVNSTLVLVDHLNLEQN